MTSPPFPLPPNFAWPAYDGRSIANVPATIAHLLGADFSGLPPLAGDLWQPFTGGAKRVVLVVLDAFGWNLMQAEQAGLDTLLRRADGVGQLTSIFPSTTVAALSSLWTGAAPAQHGMLGLTMFLPEFATAAQMLAFTPTFGLYPNALTEAGLQPETFLQWPGLAEQLAGAGVPTYAFKGREIINSVLSRMHGRGTSGDYGVITMSDMLAQMSHLLQQNAGRPLYLSAYWPSIDTLSHYRMWDGAATRAEIRLLFHQLQTGFLDGLPAAARQDTVLFIAADHGQVAFTHPIVLEDHPTLQQMLFMKPTGEPRVAYLYARHGRVEEIVQYINAHLSHAMIPVAAEAALASGLFGPPPHTAVARERIGDVVVIMRDGYVLIDRQQESKGYNFISGHGGMTRAEMHVPWIGLRLDGW